MLLCCLLFLINKLLLYKELDDLMLILSLNCPVYSWLYLTIVLLLNVVKANTFGLPAQSSAL